MKDHAIGEDGAADRNLCPELQERRLVLDVLARMVSLAE
jgi:hypothetical protein